MRKTGTEKLNNRVPAKIVEIKPGGKWRPGKMLVPRPRDIDDAIQRIRKGEVKTLSQIRRELSDEAGADYTCPLTAGIFVRVAAEAAEEARAEGKTRLTPYWRVVKDDGALYLKFPGGVAAQAQRLREEGCELLQHGKTWKVALR